MDVATRTGAKHPNNVHVTLRGLKETEALEQYIHDRIDRQSSEGPEVLWYEVVARGTNHHHGLGPYSAEITAHLLDKDVLVSLRSDDIFLVTRDAFDELSQRLSQMGPDAQACAYATKGK